MKKIIKTLFVLSLCIFVSACSSSSIAQIQPSDVNDKISKKETFVLVVSSSECAACKAYSPELETFTKENPDIKIFDVEIESIKDEQEKTNFINKFTLRDTPQTIIFKDGEIVGVQSGLLSSNELKIFVDEKIPAKK